MSLIDTHEFVETVNRDLQTRLLTLFPGGGYFVEAGAHDGIGDSQTLWLERYGWAGLLVEPSRSGQSLGKNRPKCRWDRRCLYSSNAWVRYKEVEGDHRELSGIVGHFYDDWDRNSYEHLDQWRQAIPLHEMLRHHRAPADVQFLCLDTEGTEVDILRSHDHSAYRILTVWVEYNNVPSRRAELQDLMCGTLGYKETIDNGHDLFFAHESLGV